MGVSLNMIRTQLRQCITLVAVVVVVAVIAVVAVGVATIFNHRPQQQKQ